MRFVLLVDSNLELNVAEEGEVRNADASSPLMFYPTRHLIRFFQNFTRIIPKTMKIDTPLFHSLFTPELMKLNSMFEANNFQLKMAGGAVRDLLMEIKPSDIDFASDATPSQMTEIFEKNGVRIFNKNGVEHGTISCRIDDKENFEITTLRIDVICDGRRAKVEFTTDWEKDANRRDLTINSLFLVIDYFGGIEDIKNRRVVFVGDAVTRIQEDYLRILRYFRFFGRISRPESKHDEKCIEAIVANKAGLSRISGERIWSELKKICVGPLASEVMEVMLDRCALSSYLGLPEGPSLNNFKKIYNYNASRNLMPMTVLSALFLNRKELETFHKRCKLSNAELNLAEFIIDTREEASCNITSLKFFRDVMVDLERAPDRVNCWLRSTNNASNLWTLLMTSKIPAEDIVFAILYHGTDKKKLGGRELVVELAKYCLADSELIDSLKSWEIPVFPISGVDLMDVKIPAGPFMREVLKHLFKIWKLSNYTATKEDLLLHVEKFEPDPSLLQSKGRAKKRRLDIKN